MTGFKTRVRAAPNPLVALGALMCALAALAAACGGGGVAAPNEVETCLREAGLGVARQSGVSPPVETKVNFDISSGTPDPAESGSVIYYESEDDAKRNHEASGGSGPKDAIERKGRVLYTPFGAQATGGRSAEESRTLVEGCVTQGQAGATEDDDGTKKRKKRR
jgi:hypothetical protein